MEGMSEVIMMKFCTKGFDMYVEVGSIRLKHHFFFVFSRVVYFVKGQAIRLSAS